MAKLFFWCGLPGVLWEKNHLLCLWKACSFSDGEHVCKIIRVQELTLSMKSHQNLHCLGSNRTLTPHVLILPLSSQLPNHDGLLEEQPQREAEVLRAGEEAGRPAAGKRATGTTGRTVSCQPACNLGSNTVISSLLLGGQGLHTPRCHIYDQQWVSPCNWPFVQWEVSCNEPKLQKHWKRQVR